MSVIGRDVMERGAPPRGWEAPSVREVRESLSHSDVQAWTAASSHNRPQAARSAAAPLGEKEANRERVCCCCCWESAFHMIPHWMSAVLHTPRLSAAFYKHGSAA